MHKLQQVLGSNLEAVNESSLMSDPNSGCGAGRYGYAAARYTDPRRGAGGGTLVSLQSSNAAAASRVPAAVQCRGRGDIGILHHSDERGVGRLRKS